MFTYQNPNYDNIILISQSQRNYWTPMADRPCYTCVETMLTAGGNCVLIDTDFVPLDCVIYRNLSIHISKLRPRMSQLVSQPNRCHDNCRIAAELRDELDWILGWALTDDGMWRPHSFLFSRGQIIETTPVARTLYCGRQV